MSVLLTAQGEGGEMVSSDVWFAFSFSGSSSPFVRARTQQELNVPLFHSSSHPFC